MFLCSVLLLTGCAGKKAPAGIPLPEDPEMREQMETQMQRAIQEQAETQEQEKAESGAQKCVVIQQCGSEADLCWAGRCWTKDELYAEFTKCDNMKCSTPCENCAGSTESCITAASGPTSMFFICADCFRSDSCKEGYKCEVGRCVPK